MKQKLSLPWHIVNAVIGLALFFPTAFFLMLVLGLFAGMPAQSGMVWASQKFGALIFVITFEIGVSAIAARTIWANRKQCDPKMYPSCGNLFYIKHGLKYLILMIALIAIPAIAIPFVEALQKTWIEMGSFLVITLFTLVASSTGADRHWAKQQQTINLSNQVKVDPT